VGSTIYPTLLSADITGLIPGTALSFAVRALNSVGAGSWSSSTPPSLAPAGAPGPVGKPSVFPPTSSSVTSLDVTWAAPTAVYGSAVTGYLVEVWGDDAPVAPVQRIILSNTLGADDLLCTSLSSCHFTLSFNGVNCEPLPLNAAAADIRYSLLTCGGVSTPILPSAGIAVTRVKTVLGYQWDVSFLGTVGGLGSASVPLLRVLTPTLNPSSSAQNSLSNCVNGGGPPPAGTTNFDNSCIKLVVQPTFVSRGAPIHGMGERQTLAFLQEDTDPTVFTAPTGYFSLSSYSPTPGTSFSPPIPASTTPLLPVSILPDRLASVLKSSLGLSGSLVVTRTPLVNAKVTLSTGLLPSGASTPTLQAIGGNNSAVAGNSWKGFLFTLAYAPGEGDVPPLALDALRVSSSTPTATLNILTMISDGSSSAVDSTGALVAGPDTLTTQGMLPAAYTSLILPPTATIAHFTNLTPGSHLYATVSPLSAVGQGPATLALCSPSGSTYCSGNSAHLALSRFMSSLLPTPTGVDIYRTGLPQLTPSSPRNVTLSLDPAGTSTALSVSYSPPLSSGGLPISTYRIEWSPAADFSTSLARLDVPCSPAASPYTFVITTKEPAPYAGTGLWMGVGSNSVFALSVTRGGVTATTSLIASSALPAASQEVAGQSHGVYCQTNNLLNGDSGPHPVSCISPSGSLQSAIEALPNMGPGTVASVTRSSTPGVTTPGQYVWTIVLAASLGNSASITVAPGSVNFFYFDNINAMDSSVLTTTVASPGVAFPEGMDTACIAPQLITGLQQGTPYYVHVLAYNAIGYSSPAAATPAGGLAAGGLLGAPLAPITTPARPTAVAVAPASSTQLRVSWGQPLDNGGQAVTYFVVSWGTGVDIVTGALTGSTGSVTVTYLPDSGPYSRTLNGLLPGVDYYVRVAAGNTRGVGAAAASLPIVEHPRTLPASPLNTRVAPVSPRALSVSWAPPSNNGGDPVTYYTVEWDTDPLFESNRKLPHKGVKTLLATTTTAATITDLASGTGYYVRVSAGNGVGFGAWGSDPTASPATPTLQTPGLPASVSLRPSNATCATLTLLFYPPLIPSSGVLCAGGGTNAPGVPNSCPAGATATSGVADGGSAITSYEVHFSLFSDFRDVAPGGKGMLSFPVPVTADPTSLIAYEVGPAVGAALSQSGSYYVRVAARNGVGTGPFCGNTGAACVGNALLATAPVYTSGSGLACP